MNLEEYETHNREPGSIKKVVEGDLIEMGKLFIENGDEKSANSCFEKAGLSKEDVKKIKKEAKAGKNRSN